MSTTPDDRVREALADMISNGAVFRVVDGSAGRSFVYEVIGGGSSDRCRRVLRDVRSDSAVFAAFRAAVFDLAEASQ